MQKLYFIFQSWKCDFLPFWRKWRGGGTTCNAWKQPSLTLRPESSSTILVTLTQLLYKKNISVVIKHIRKEWYVCTTVPNLTLAHVFLIHSIVARNVYITYPISRVSYKNTAGNFLENFWYNVCDALNYPKMH